MSIDEPRAVRRLGDRLVTAAFVALTAAVVVWLTVGAMPALVAAFGPIRDGVTLLGRGDTAIARAASRVVVASDHTDHALRVVLEYLFSAANLTLGVLLVRLRPHDRVARLLAVGMIGTAATFNHQSHSIFTFDLLGASAFVNTTHRFLHLVSGLSYVFAVVMFPDGQLVPRTTRGRGVISAVYLAGALILTRVSLASTALGHPGQPFFVRLFGVVIPVAGGLAQTYRLRRPAGAEQRQQSRLLLSALLPMLLAGIVFLVLPSIEGGARTQHLGLAVFPALFAVIPVALAVGVLRYRLWDIDVVVNRALLFATLAGSIGAIYVAVVVGLGDVLGGRSNSRWLSIVALATVAVAIEPARRRLQIVANRLVYGTRSAPADVIERAGRQLAQSSTDALDRLAVVVADGVAATRVDVWIRVGSELITTASAPGQAPVERREIHGDAVPVIPGRHCVPVHSQGRLVGLLAVAKRPGETITRAEGRLLSDVASQAQLVMRNAQLTAELGAQLEVLSAHAVALQETRRRVVTLQDEERRRIERDIHDGAQQHLVALAVQLGLARAAVAESPTEARTQLPEAQGAFRDAIASLHDLARGIYPAVLVDDGIAPALQMQAERLGLEVRMDVSGSARPPAAVESAVYFACAEALQNVAKHARATTVDVVLREESDELRFTVGDDGVGFDVGPGGSGIVNMADRIKTLGGSLSVWSEPGGGTTVQGVVPLAEINP